MCSVAMPDTFRIYLRHPPQRVTNKTTTTSYVVAQAAFFDLLKHHAGDAALLCWTENGRGYWHVQLDGPSRSCSCGYRGPMMTEDNRCPMCFDDQVSK